MELVDRTAVPTTGFWRRGSVVINSDWAAGEAVYWVCTASGEPGTWVAVYTTAPETSLVVPAATSPSQTTDASIVWDSNDDLLTVGTGAGRKTMLDTDSTQTATNKTLTAPVLNDATTTSGNGAKNGATVTAAENLNAVRRTVLTLASTPVTVANTTGASFGGVKLYDFPAGRILIHGVTANLSFDWSASDIVATGSGDFSLGTTITSDATLDGTDVDLLPSTALTDPFVDGVGTGAGALAASAQFDGTATAVDANLNLIIDDADVEDDTSAVVLVSGTVTITWSNLGDY